MEWHVCIIQFRLNRIFGLVGMRVIYNKNYHQRSSPGYVRLLGNVLVVGLGVSSTENHLRITDGPVWCCSKLQQLLRQ